MRLASSLMSSYFGRVFAFVMIPRKWPVHGRRCLRMHHDRQYRQLPEPCRIEVTLSCKSCMSCRAVLPPESLPQQVRMSIRHPQIRQTYAVRIRQLSEELQFVVLVLVDLGAHACDDVKRSKGSTDLSPDPSRRWPKKLDCYQALLVDQYVPRPFLCENRPAYRLGRCVLRWRQP